MPTRKIIASSPGKVILVGEHAVVYGKLGIAASIGKRCFVTALPGGRDILIDAINLGIKKKLSKEVLYSVSRKIEKIKKKQCFDEIAKICELDPLSPIYFIIFRIMYKHKYKPMRIRIRSYIPKNLGSSSAVFASTALAVSKFLNVDLKKKEISDLAYDGDVIAHAGTPSGIDNSIVTYGGFIKYKKSEGVKKLKINFKLPLIFVDSGETAKTSKTVSHIRRQREKNREFVDDILDKLNEISMEFLNALNRKDLGALGKLMFQYYYELRKLKISTKKLDHIIKVAIENGALGAKPTGGWGGGCCIVLARDAKQIFELIKMYKRKGYNSFISKIGVEGTRLH
ncbi:MAG: mevalonate kinase [Candidatus Nanoarchaeia archaeon]|nr:mevalonate kinase [Candidatus Jingweiarchaeum tengchongense]